MSKAMPADSSSAGVLAARPGVAWAGLRRVAEGTTAHCPLGRMTSPWAVKNKCCIENEESSGNGALPWLVQGDEGGKATRAGP